MRLRSLLLALLAVPFAVGQFVMSPRSASLVNRYGARAIGVAGLLIAPLFTTNDVYPRAADKPIALAIAPFGSPQIFPAMTGIP